MRRKFANFNFFFILSIIFTLEVGIKPVIYLLIAVVGSLVIAATLILIISKVRAIDPNKGELNSNLID